MRTLCVALLLLSACKKDPPAQGGGDKPVAGKDTPTAPPTGPIGTTDPFARLSSAAGTALQKGYKAQRSKKWDEATAAFKEVIAAAPDYAPARWQLVRTLALSGVYTEIPAAYEAMIARDYVGTAAKLDKPKEMNGLRGAPEWAKITELRERYKSAWAAGLDKGFFFVARTRAAAEPKFEGGATDASLALNQEVFHYDPEGKRFRRMTDSDGGAFALHRAPDGKMLVFLVAPKLHREGGADAFTDPKVGVIDLTTLETIGPYSQKGRFDQVVLGANKSGQPLFTFYSASTPATYSFDTAKTGLAKIEGDAIIPIGGETRAWPNQVAHVAAAQVEKVKLADGASQFTIEGVDGPILAARPLQASSLEWSPGKTRLTYAGKLDACKILKAAPGEKADKNELYVYDVTKKSAQRIAAAISGFETLWLDDDRLVYEGGVGKDGQIHVYAMTAHADATLPTKNGAGLYGVPTLACERAETNVDESVTETESEAD
jgi:hypothetical protein